VLRPDVKALPTLRYLLQALDVARLQGALSWELRAAMSLARLWSGQQPASQAGEMLASVYLRFTEGFGTADLIAAMGLLAPVL
jgi:predicted ATPase